MGSFATISSSSSEDDEARRAFAEVALQAERGLASGPCVAQSQGPNAPSARNPRIAEALDRMIGGTLAFESVRGNANDENDENDEKGTPGERASASVGRRRGTGGSAEVTGGCRGPRGRPIVPERPRPCPRSIRGKQEKGRGVSTAERSRSEQAPRTPPR